MNNNSDIVILDITTLNDILEIFEKIKLTEKTIFKENIQLYGLINYARNQYFPKLSSFITENENYKDIFFNYTAVESMILDLIMVIESDLIIFLDNKENLDYEKLNKLINFSVNLLKILKNIIINKNKFLEEKIDLKSYDNNNNSFTTELFNLQNKFYTLVYDEKLDSRLK